MDEILNYSTDTLVNILDEISDVIILAKDLKNFWVNKAFCELFGYSKEEAIGKGLDLIIDTGDLQILKVDLKKKLSGKKTQKKYEIIVYSKDRKKKYIELVAKYIKLDEEDALLVVINNITNKRKTVDRLINSERKFRSLFENLPIGIFIYNKNFIVIDTNKSFDNILNAPKENILGIDVSNLKDKAFISEIIKTKKGQSGFYKGEYTTTVTNKELWVVVNTEPILDNNGNFNGGIGIFTDISKQKELEAQFNQAQKLEAVGRLTGGIAHDFNNILTVIKGYSDLVLKKTEKENQNYRRIEEIKKAGDRASDLIQQLMAFSRKQIVKADVLDVPEIVNDLKGMISRIIGEEIKFQVEVKGKTGLIFADKNQINQVILNLLVNAKDALDERDIPDFEKNIMIEIGEVFLDDDFVKNNPGSRIGRNVSLSVMDNGIGIKQEILNKIFEPFYTTKQKGKGTGLGLSTVYGIIKQNGGYVYAKSKLGSWTIFTTLWPVEEHRAKTVDIEEKKNVNQSRGLRLLVVEDEESVRDYLTETLRDNGFIVDEAENGVLALEKVRESGNKIDYIISDIVMPVMDGERLAEILRVECPDKKIILMSGYTASESLLNKIKENDYAFVKKPFIIEDLISMIK